MNSISYGNVRLALYIPLVALLSGKSHVVYVWIYVEYISFHLNVRTIAYIVVMYRKPWDTRRC